MNYDINSRIFELRKFLKISQTDFGNGIGVSRGVIKNIDENKVEAKPLLIEQICKMYNVNKQWLLTGEGEMFNALTKNEQLAEFVGTVLGEEEESFKQRILNMLSNLSDDGWAFLEQMVDDLAEQKEDGEK